MAMDLLAEPAQQAAEIAASEGVVEVTELGPGGGEELGRVDVAQRVGGEIANQPGTPMDVLEAALCVVGRGDAQAFPVLLIPRRGEVANRQVPGEQGLLQ